MSLYTLIEEAYNSKEKALATMGLGALGAGVAAYHGHSVDQLDNLIDKETGLTDLEANNFRADAALSKDGILGKVKGVFDLSTGKLDPRELAKAYQTDPDVKNLIDEKLDPESKKYILKIMNLQDKFNDHLFHIENDKKELPGVFNGHANATAYGAAGLMGGAALGAAATSDTLNPKKETKQLKKIEKDYEKILKDKQKLAEELEKEKALQSTVKDYHLESTPAPPAPQAPQAQPAPVQIPFHPNVQYYYDPLNPYGLPAQSTQPTQPIQPIQPIQPTLLR